MEPKKGVPVQCSLLPAPSLSFGCTLGSKPEAENLTDLNTDEVTTEADDSDTDYMYTTVRHSLIVDPVPVYYATSYCNHVHMCDCCVAD